MTLAFKPPPTNHHIIIATTRETGAQEKFLCEGGVLEDDGVDERHDERMESELSGRWRAKRCAEGKKLCTRQREHL